MDDRVARRHDYPLTIPDSLLYSEAMRRACATHDFREIFRLVNRRTGSSYATIAAAVGKMTSSRVSDIIRGVRRIRGREVIERVADGFGIPGHMLGLPRRPWEDGPSDTSKAETTSRRDAVKLAGLALTAPVIAQLLEQAADEAFAFTQQVEASTLTPGVIDHLEAAVAAFNRAYTVEPPEQLFGAVLDYRRKVDRLLQTRHTHKEGRELLAFAGWLSELLAWLAHDLGNAHTGLAFASDAFAHAQQAGHGELCAWAMDAAASISMYQQRPAHALAAARRGLAEVPGAHPLTVRLHAQAARAYAADSNAEGFTVAFQAAEDAYQRLPARSPRRFGADVMPLADYALTSYPATACIWLGQAERARQYAERALTTYESAAPECRSPSREAIARIDLALAQAQLGNPDEAVSLGHHALDSPRVVDSVRHRANDLTTYLVRRYPRHAAVEGLRERLTSTGAMRSTATSRDTEDF